MRTCHAAPSSYLVGLPQRQHVLLAYVLCPYANSSFSWTDRISIRSYRTDISMSDFENSRDFGANDNMGASPVTQETTLGGKDGMSLAQGNARPPGENKN